MSEKLTINKSTTISVGIVVLIVGATFFVARLEAASGQHSKDIASLAGRIDRQIEVNEQQNDTNQELNENIIKLNARLDNLSQQQSSIVTVVPVRQVGSQIIIERNTGMQPNGRAPQQHGVQPTPPQSPRPPEQPEPSLLADVTQRAVDAVFNLLER
jgi:hypothetical protein